MTEQSELPFFRINQPIRLVDPFYLDKLARSTKIKHDEKTGCGEFFKVVLTYGKENGHYLGLFCKCLSIIAFPPNEKRDFWILKTGEPRHDAPRN